jgi:hypothetical protein
VLAEILDLDVPEGLEGPVRNQHLAAVAGRAQPRDVVDVDADVVVVLDRGFARVDSHADADGALPWPGMGVVSSLDRDRGLERVLGAPEREEELVAAAVDLEAASILELASHETAVVADDRRVLVSEIAHEARRVLDVREQKRHRSRRLLDHAASLERSFLRQPRPGCTHTDAGTRRARGADRRRSRTPRR